MCVFYRGAGDDGGEPQMMYLELSARLLLVLVFAAAVLGKVRGRRAFESFAASVDQFGVVPRRWTPMVARATILVEAAAALALAVPATVAAGYVIAGGLLAALTVAAAVALRRGRRPNCHCFGVAGTPISRRHLVRNVALALVAGLGLVGQLVGTGPGQPAGAALAAVAAVVMAALVVRLDDLVALFATGTSVPAARPRTGGPSGSTPR
jgi:hypothetical protein